MRNLLDNNIMMISINRRQYRNEDVIYADLYDAGSVKAQYPGSLPRYYADYVNNPGVG